MSYDPDQPPEVLPNPNQPPASASDLSPDVSLPVSQPPPSLTQVLRELPGQYWRVITRPRPDTLVVETNKATWSIVSI